VIHNGKRYVTSVINVARYFPRKIIPTQRIMLNFSSFRNKSEQIEANAKK
jgi:hypothetical protein